MRWAASVYAALSTSSVALRRQLPLIGEAFGVRSPKASPPRGGGSAKPRRRGRIRFATTSQSAFGCQLPCKGSLFYPLRQGSPLRRFAPAPLDKGSLSACKYRRFPRKKVQPDNLRPHLLLMADILQKLVTNLIPPYQAARSQTPVR